MAKKVIHHPGIRKQIERSPRLAALLIENSGWREGPLPDPEPVEPVTPPPSEDEAKTSAKKDTAKSSTSAKS